MRWSMVSKSRCRSGSFSLTARPTVVCSDWRWTRPVRSPARSTSSRMRSVRSTNWVDLSVAKSSRVALNPRPRAKAEAGFGPEAPAARKRRPTTWTRPLLQTRPGPRAARCRPGCGSREPGTGRRPGASSAARHGRPGPAAGCRARSAPRRARAWAAGPAQSALPRRGSRGRRRTAHLTTGPRDGRARGRAVGRSYGFHHAPGQLAEGRQGAQAGLVVAGHDVVQPESEHGIQDEWHEHVARHREADPPVLLEAVELLLDDLAVAGEELGQVRPQALGSRCLDQEVEGGELDVAQPPQRVPERLDADFEDFQRVGQLVEGSAKLLDRLGRQVPPGLHQQLGLGREPVLEVADGDAGLGGDGPDAGAGVAVFEERVGRRVDDLVSGALGGGRPGHTYVPA